MIPRGIQRFKFCFRGLQIALEVLNSGGPRILQGDLVTLKGLGLLQGVPDCCRECFRGPRLLNGFPNYFSGPKITSDNFRGPRFLQWVLNTGIIHYT